MFILFKNKAIQSTTNSLTQTLKVKCSFLLSEIFLSLLFLPRYFKMAACCCSPCRPAYKRHVDAIYPAAAEDGLVKGKMESLVYYAMTSPEKLDRIGIVYTSCLTSSLSNRQTKPHIGVSISRKPMGWVLKVYRPIIFFEIFLALK